MTRGLQKTNTAAKFFSPLVGFGWLASARQHQKTLWLSMNELLEAIKNGNFHLPLQVSCKQQDAAEQRFFIVADHWLDDLSQV